MLIQCTKKLLDELKITPAERPEENTLFSWHANMIKLGRKKTLVLVNDHNYYVIVLYGVKANIMKKLDRFIPQAIEQVFRAEGIKEGVISQYVNQLGDMSISKTKDRKSVGKLNKACENVSYFEDMINEEELVQEELSMRISSMLIGNGKNRYLKPHEEMYKDLEELTGQSIFHSQAVEMKVTLQLVNDSVWRKLTIPTNTTFTRLHNILQDAFGWHDSHLHDFSIYPLYQTNNVIPINKDKPILQLVCDEEAYEYQGDIPMKMETGVKLSDLLPARIVYNYDFGDDWQHVIEVERVVEDYKVNYPICNDGEGNAPPEDVGGEGGYEEFLKIIDDESHPDHEHMVNWGEMQGYEKFDLREINWRLKH
ncbi:plasmid pRiA4b ORF-3 family protein [Alkalihalobacillus sp. R86527]|uniref:plasmid pRiA4b ORF-3 family protein n=1 Tax=Alkalihalobacillus sp. R86527 TaxID=3093863 RepID=UPI00366F86F9